MGHRSRGGRKVARALAWLAVAVLLVGLGRTTWYAFGPAATDARLLGQVRWLNSSIAGDDAAAQMQAVFPEGEMFTLALTALATAQAAATHEGRDRADLVQELRIRVSQLQSPEVTSRYQPASGLEHGIFVAGWQLHAEVALSRLSNDPVVQAQIAAHGRAILDAVAGSEQPFLESYPGATWPVDTVVAMAAVAEADRAVGVTGAAGALADWVQRARLRSVDGLLPHQVDSTGVPLDAARGSSSALGLAFLPVIDPQWSAVAWQTFTDRFVTRVAGAVGIQEFAQGSARAGDIDSGPLIAGVSVSATAVAVGAARANGSPDLAADLMRQAEIAGLPIDLFGQRRYAAGLLPIGDAFLAWARSVPEADPGGPAGPRPLWWAWCAPWLGAALAWGTIWWLRRRPIGSSG